MTPAEYKKMCGARLKQARLEKGLTLKQLHAQLGFHRSRSNLGNYEAGLRLPPPWEAHLLANALGVTASYLLCLDEGQMMLRPEEEKLLRYWRALPENERHQTASSIEVRALRYMRSVPDQKHEHISAEGKTIPAPTKPVNKKRAASTDKRGST